MGAGAPVLAFDCEFNREVTDGAAFFWSDAESLAAILDEVADAEVDDELTDFAEAGRDRITAHYQWDAVTDEYEALLNRLAATKPRKGRRVKAQEAADSVA